MTIVSMSQADVPEVALLEKECFSTPWSEQALEMELKNKCAVFYVAKEQDQVAGYIGMHAVLDEGYMANVAVREAFRRQGIATGLLNALIVYAEEHRLGFLTLEVRENNLPAIAFYEKQGFGTVGRRRGYYKSPMEDALLMTRFFGRRKENQDEDTGN